jgi:hypothetical protein
MTVHLRAASTVNHSGRVFMQVQSRVKPMNHRQDARATSVPSVHMRLPWNFVVLRRGVVSAIRRALAWLWDSAHGVHETDAVSGRDAEDRVGDPARRRAQRAACQVVEDFAADRADPGQSRGGRGPRGQRLPAAQAHRADPSPACRGSSRPSPASAQAIERKEKITIYGDYDVDGITGVSILWELLTLLGAQVDYYIPHRIDEGYGLNATRSALWPRRAPDCW